MKRIFLDMDGVLTDFVGGAIRHTNSKYNIAHWPKGEYNMVKVLKLDAKRFWTSLDHFYWACLEPTVEFYEIIRVLEGLNVCILTSPASTGHSGKFEWLRNHMPNVPYLMGNNKHFCAHHDAILIDDADTNCVKFDQHGGHSIIWPQPWNSAHHIEDKIEYLKRQLRIKLAL